MANPYRTTTVRISQELKDAIEKRAAESDHSQNALMEHALCVAFGVAFKPSESPARGGWPRRGATKLRARRAKP